MPRSSPASDIVSACFTGGAGRRRKSTSCSCCRTLSLTETSYAVDAVDWLDGAVDFIVRQPEGGQVWRLRALIAVAPDTPLSVHVVDVPVAVPEPTRLPLVAATLLALLGSRRWSVLSRSARHGKSG
jgi:hypothetical protein